MAERSWDAQDDSRGRLSSALCEGGPATVPLPIWPSLPARPTALMDGYARVVARQFKTPVALVSLVSKGGQVSPGAVGLPEPWATWRSVPLSHSLCRYVVDRAAPLFVEDATAHPLVHDNPAVTEWGVAAYGGAPLTDAGGAAIGALCAIDRRPRRWLPRDVDWLAEMAVLCSAQVQLDVAVDAAQEARAAAERAAALARAAESAALATMADARAEVQRHRRMRRIAAALASLTTATEIAGAVSRLCREQLSTAAVLLGVTSEPATELRLLPAPHAVRGLSEGTVIPLAEDSPIRTAVREHRPVGLPTGRGAGGPSGYTSRVDLPLALPAPHLGVLSLRWKRPYNLGTDAALLGELARHTAWAVQRTLPSHWP